MRSQATHSAAPPRPRPRAMLLDAMGTLVRLPPPAPALREELDRRFGLRVSRQDADAAIRAEIAFYRRHMLEGRDPAGVAALRRRCAEVVRSSLPPLADVAPEDVEAALLASLRFEAHADAGPALRELRARAVRLVVVSNWDASLHDVLARTGLADLVDAVVTSAEVGAAKPAAAIFERGLALAGATAREALHVGDTPEEDVAGALAAGIAPVLLARDAPAPERGRAVAVIASLAELPALCG